MFKFLQCFLWTTVSICYAQKLFQKKKEKGSILTLPGQSGTSESATVSMFCFVISSSICYWLFKCRDLCVMRRVCVWVRETGSHQSVQPVRNRLNRGLCTANTYKHHHCVCHATFGLKLIKLTWKQKLTIMVRGVIFPTRACGVRPITMHWVSWPIRADCTY